jgi:D-3-phosphoglycerate dehydrogenase
MKVLISDKSAPQCAEILRRAGHQVDEKFGISPETLITIIEQYDGLIVRSATKVTKDLLIAGKNLKVIGRAGSGVDNIDVQSANEHHIVVMNTPGVNTNAVAELTITYLLVLSRNIYNATHSLKEGKWEKKKLIGYEILGKTLGLIGYGKIGKRVAQKAINLGMKVVYFDPYVVKEEIKETEIKFLEVLEDVLSKADYISIHVPKSSKTLNLISKAEFNKMKRGAYFINCSRGGIVNETDLLNALNAGIIKAAGIDVFDTEPTSNLDLIRHPNVTCSPHLGASSVEAQTNVAVQIAEQFVDMFAGKVIKNEVKVKR